MSVEALKKSKTMSLYQKNGVVYLKFNILNNYPFVNHAVSTRIGGVSEGDALKYLNLGFKTDDDPQNVRENYKRFCAAAGFNAERLVFAKQTHSANYRITDENDLGKGIFCERDYTDVDALITNKQNIGLVIHTADCVPVSFTDIKNRVIANAHCGWRGTYEQLAQNTLDGMTKNYGTRPENVVVTIGPCICAECYEVSQELYNDFYDRFGFDDFITKRNDKYYLDLPNINKQILINAGIPAQNIAVSDLCTKCLCDVLYSHRGLGAKRGLLSSVICMNEKCTIHNA